MNDNPADAREFRYRTLAVTAGCQQLFYFPYFFRFQHARTPIAVVPIVFSEYGIRKQDAAHLDFPDAIRFIPIESTVQNFSPGNDFISTTHDKIPEAEKFAREKKSRGPSGNRGVV